ncbi:hypothetical protein [Maridesulfovibrio sp.]|uniref:hypothetical protein n=1 Tax=Maridesulfovibrio sp. TaxID=2795000 RepID=UPI002AA8FEE4|nr:hypothetical protein [Maridesulfovibrio sp.]
MDGQGANAFMQNFLSAFNTGQDRSTRRERYETLREEQQKDRDFRKLQFDFQKDQTKRSNDIADLTRQANSLAFSGQLQGDAEIYGRDSRELESKYGFNPYGYVSPQAMNYQTPEQQRKTKIDTAATIAAINAKYSALGKTPKFDVIEDGTGNQKYIIKGNTIPTGWKVSKPAAVNINQGGGVIVGPGGVKLSATEVRDNRKALGATEGVSNSLDRLEELVNQYGWEPSTGFNAETVAQMEAAHRGVQMEMKELLNLGVLNGPDLELMDQILLNPTEVPGNPLKWANRQDALLASYQEVRKLLERKKAQFQKNLGIQEQPPKTQQNNPDPLGIR